MGRKQIAAKEAGAVTKHPKAVVQEALQTTFVLKGTLKRAQLMFLRVGELLVKVRDQKLYEALNHPDMDSYAQERLGLGRSSLYNYLRIHDWVSRSHPEWLKPKAKGFVPDLSDVGDLMWIESELARTDLSPARRATLEELQKKGLAGKLRQAEARKLRTRENTGEAGLNSLISKLRSVRKRAGQLANLPPEALQHLDAAIEILANEKVLRVAFAVPRDAYAEKWRQNLSA
jgi:hypothetical protein